MNPHMSYPLRTSITFNISSLPTDELFKCRELICKELDRRVKYFVIYDHKQAAEVLIYGDANGEQMEYLDADGKQKYVNKFCRMIEENVKLDHLYIEYEIPLSKLLLMNNGFAWNARARGTHFNAYNITSYVEESEIPHVIEILNSTINPINIKDVLRVISKYELPNPWE